jgi:hypothetical protein
MEWGEVLMYDDACRHLTPLPCPSTNAYGLCQMIHGYFNAQQNLHFIFIKKLRQEKGIGIFRKLN